MTRTTTAALPLILLATVAGCGGSPTTPTAPTSVGLADPPDPARVNAYLEEMIGIMQTHSANAGRIDWSRYRAEVLAAGGNAQTIPEAYPAIELALRFLEDGESLYLARDNRRIGGTQSDHCGIVQPDRPLPPLPPTIGYVKVDRTASGQTANSIQQAIRTADRPGLAGWIVDLRGNAGGNMWPMIAGVGPVLGEGIIGWIIYNNREYEREYRNGAALSLNEAFARADVPYALLQPNPRVAVLTDRWVISAGEGVAVYFRGRPNTRSFGTPTCGTHHLFQEYGLSDRGLLVLITAIHADRTRTLYEGPIVPDELIPDAGTAVNRAIEWLSSGH